MKAITVLEPGKAVFEEAAEPKPAKDMVKIRVLRAGVCATDFSIYTGECSFVKSGDITYPVRFGHEYAGIVEEVGEEVTEFQKGDRVFTENAVSCGECPACQEGRYDDCTKIRSVGTVNCWDGCFAEYMYMPQRHVFHVPDGISLDEAALLEPASISYACFHNISLDSSMTVAVVGTGAIGLSAAWLAKFLGAGRVIMAGRNESKLRIARQIGADETINCVDCDLAESLRKMTGGKGVDMLIEASGSSKALYDSLRGTAKNGFVSLPAFYERDLNDFPIDHVVLQCLTLCGAAGRFGNPQKASEIMRDNPISLAPIITHRIKFADAVDFFTHPEQWPRDKIKVMIEFD